MADPANLTEAHLVEANLGYVSYFCLIQCLEADQRARQMQKPGQHLGVPLVAELQAPVAHQPRQRPLHHVPMAAQPIACSMPRQAIRGVIPRRRSTRRQRG